MSFSFAQRPHGKHCGFPSPLAMDCAGWPPALDPEDAAALDEALQLVGGDTLLGDEDALLCADQSTSKAALGSALIPPAPRLNANSARELRRGDSGELAVLNATRAFLDECDIGSDADEEEMDDSHHGHASPATVSSSHSDTDVGKETIARNAASAARVRIVTKSARRHRVRPKEELARLREEESQLVSKLRDLRLEARRRLITSSRGNSSRKASSDKLAVRRHSLLFWERAASRQLQHRQRSEQENRRLKGLLQGQIRRTRQLQQALSRRLVESVGTQLDHSCVRFLRLACCYGRYRNGRNVQNRTHQSPTASRETMRPCSRCCSVMSTRFTQSWRHSTLLEQLVTTHRAAWALKARRV